MPGEVLGRVFRATLDLLVAYKDQVAGLYATLSLSVTLDMLKCIIRNILTSIFDSQLLYFVEAAKEEEEEEDDDDMDGFQTDDEVEDDSGSDREMGADAEDGDEAASSNLRKLADQVRGCNSEDR